MPAMLTVGSLFTGIGGFDLGFERAGMQIAWQCEIDQFCIKVLEKHWPNVRHYGDITGLKPSYADVLCGGFPCQDLSVAGHSAGLSGSRSGLWFEFGRIIREVRPRYVVIENVTALKTRGLDIVLADLAACGYDAEWQCLPAEAFGAPHKRDRIWVVAYPNSDPLRDEQGRRNGSSRLSAPLARNDGETQCVASPVPQHYAWWEAEPDICRVVDGVPDRVDRVRSLGNALVPQIAEWIGEKIIVDSNGR